MNVNRFLRKSKEFILEEDTIMNPKKEQLKVRVFFYIML